MAEIRDKSPRWYVVHTRTGYENKVKTDLEKTVENRHMQDRIMEIKIPTEEVVEIKDGKKKVVSRKIYPCYIMVKMIMDNESWYVVRNASGVTGFVARVPSPVPLTDEEVAVMGVENIPIELDVEVGDAVKITGGILENFTAVVSAIDTENQKLTVLVNMMGRDTSVEVDFINVQKI